MNEQLQAKLVEILSGIQSATKAAGDFALGQLPDIAQSYVMYGRVRTVAISAVLLLLGAALLGLSRWAYKHPWNTSNYSFEKDQKRSESNYLAMVFPGIFGAAFTMLGLLTFDFLVWFAPKVWLLKELASLVK